MKALRFYGMVLALAGSSAQVFGQSTTAFSYQGKLMVGAGAMEGACDLTFQLFSHETYIATVTGPVTNVSVAVSGGWFNTAVDFGFNPFQGGPMWLEIGVRTNAAQAFVILQPRQRILPTPYASFATEAGKVEWASLANVPVGFSDNTDNDTRYGAGGGLSLVGTNFQVNFGSSGSTSLAARSDHAHAATDITSATLADARLSTNVMLLTAPALRSAGSFTAAGAITSAGDLVGVRANIGSSNSLSSSSAGASILGGLYHTVQFNVTNSTIVGGRGNLLEEGSKYSTIGGGSNNYVGGFSEASFIGAGFNNKVMPYVSWAGILCGLGNIIYDEADSSVIGGGSANTVGWSATASVIGGGAANSISLGLPALPVSQYNVIGGGFSSSIAVGAYCSTIGGGYDHTIRTNAMYATIPGGYRNEATNRAFAAGYRAKARHTGAFVWADSTSLDFVSDREDQFKVRAGGGVYIQAEASGLNPAACRIESTTAGGVGLYVNQTSTDANAVFSNPGSGDLIKGFSGAAGANLVFRVDNDGDVTAKTFTPSSDRNLKENFAAVDPQAVLAGVLDMPICRWNFKADGTQHIGPMAQDFYAAFAVGTDDRHIATVDADGVALAAIQGLNRKLEAKEARIAELEKRLAALEMLLNRQTK